MTATVTEPASTTAAVRSRSQIASASTGPILLAIDGSPDSDMAVRVATDLAAGLKRPLHVVHCWFPLIIPTGPAGGPIIDIERTYGEPAEELLGAQVAGLEHLGAQVAGKHLLMGRPADKISGLAIWLEAQLIVIGSRGLGGVKRLVLGSISEGVVHTAATPVLVVRGGEQAWPPQRILVGDDGSKEARRAAEAAAAIAVATGAELTIATAISHAWLDAVSPGEARVAAAFRAAGEVMIDEIAGQLGAAYGLDVQTAVLFGDPAATLISTAGTGPTPALIAVGSRGLGAIERMALGSVSTKVLRGAHGPVLISHDA